jgi:hypothetical protein
MQQAKKAAADFIAGCVPDFAGHEKEKDEL